MAKFRLQAVLDYRQLLEDQARQRFAAAQRQLDACESALAEASADRRRLQQELEESQSQGMAAQEIGLYREHLTHLAQRQDQLRAARAAADRSLAESRAGLARASGDKQLLEKLKERQQALLQRKLQRQETALLDEIAVQLYKR